MAKFSKVIALALAATMVIGSSVTAFAGDNDGGSIGEGASEGHVEKKLANVQLPTMPTTGSPFEYIMDPEGLIVVTSGAKYDNTVFPASGDTQVYFNNGVNDAGKTVYLNSSKEQEVVNKSSFDIDLTVKAEVTAAQATDIPLVAQTAIATAQEASLYLGLVVGTGSSADKKAITSAAAASKTVTIEGSPDNFKVAVNEAGNGYEYRALTLEEYKATEGHSAATEIPWASNAFHLEGEVTKELDITATTTAPKINVTWSWVDPNAEDEGPDYSSATAITLTKGATTVYGMYADLAFAKADITATKVKVDDADYADIEEVGNDNAIKFTNQSSWESATSVVIYIITDDAIYKYTYK